MPVTLYAAMDIAIFGSDKTISLGLVIVKMTLLSPIIASWSALVLGVGRYGVRLCCVTHYALNRWASAASQSG